MIEEMTPTRFFSDVCPALLENKRDIVTALGGRYAFVVREHGAWLVDFDNAVVEKVKADVRADVAIELSAPAFSRLMKGTLDAGSALADGDIALAGNVQLLSKLTAALRPC